MATADPTKASIRDVAELAGVSHMTVSRVLNQHPNIKAATRDRVLQAMETLKYRPNSAARTLASKKSNRIGVLVDSPMEFGPGSTLRGVEEAARAAGYTVSSVTASHGREQSTHAALEHLMEQGVDALCVVAPRILSIELLRELDHGLPTLVVKADPDPTFLTASVDQAYGAALAVRHLIDLGHRRIAHLAGPTDWFDARARARAWEDELVAAGFPIREAAHGDWTSDSGYAWATSAELDFTAVFAGNDQMALGVMHGLVERGLRIPEDVSIVGFDDLSDARHFLPPLTTIRQDFAALGRRSVEALLAELDGRPTPRRSLIEPSLVVRGSTATVTG